MDLHLFNRNQRGFVGDFPLESILPDLGSCDEFQLSLELYTHWRSDGTEIIAVTIADVDVDRRVIFDLLRPPTDI